MRRFVIALFALTMLVCGACAEGMVSASVHVTASRSVYDSMIRVGEDVDMVVSIDGFTPTLCQWYKEDQALNGENAPAMRIDAAQVDDTGIYRMDAMDESGRIRVSVDVALRVVDHTIPKTGDSRIPTSALSAMVAVASIGMTIGIARKFLRIA